VGPTAGSCNDSNKNSRRVLWWQNSDVLNLPLDYKKFEFKC